MAYHQQLHNYYFTIITQEDLALFEQVSNCGSRLDQSLQHEDVHLYNLALLLGCKNFTLAVQKLVAGTHKRQTH